MVYDVGTNHFLSWKTTVFSWLFLLLLLILPHGLSAQNATLKGSIVAEKDKHFLSGANISLHMTEAPRATFGTSSNRRGRFEISNIPPGAYRFEVSFIGYVTYELNLIFSRGEVHELDISLKRKVLEMEQIEASAHRETIDLKSTRKLETTASVTVLDTIQIQSIRPMTLSDHLVGLAGVDVVKTGLTQSSVAIRGFNDVFASPLLLLIDNRIARIPSLRFNAFDFIPTANEDIERIEIIRGPAASLYGPNSAGGVLHVITRSPFDSKGTTLNFGIGERNNITADFRYATTFGKKLGFKMTGSLLQGNDFESRDAFEDSLRSRLYEIDASFRERGLTNPNPIDTDMERIGLRDFRLEKLAGTARFDYRPQDDVLLTFSSGVNVSTNMELTQLGAAVVQDWIYGYGQAKLIYKNLFLQAFVNVSDAGDTYSTRDGKDIVDRSNLYSYQIQHTLDLGQRQTFTYGADALLTRPVTQGTVNGVNENDDDINEIGVYLQSESSLSDRVKLVLAGRVDDHNRLDNPFFSPRAGLEYEIDPGNKLRFSFSRAFTTPSTQNLFLDRIVSPLIPDRFLSFTPFNRAQPFNVRAQGVPSTGFTFRRDSGSGVGGLYMHPVPLFVPPPANAQLIPADATLMWETAIDLITNIQGSGLDFLFNGLRDVPVPDAAEVATILKSFNPTTGDFEQVDAASVTNIKPLESSKTTTFEFGYKGFLNNKLLLDANFYYSRIQDFIGPLLLETPNVFFDPISLRDYLRDQESLTLTTPPDTTRLGPVFASLMAQIPLGTVAPDESNNPGDVLLTYRNFGDIDLFGTDLDLTYLLNKEWSFTGTYSFVSKDLFREEGGVRDIALNAPKNKFSLSWQYRGEKNGLAAGLRLRQVQGFPVNSGVFVGEVSSYAIVDLNAGFRLPGTEMKLTLTVQNLLDNRHREFVGAPELARLAHLQLKFFPDK